MLPKKEIGNISVFLEESRICRKAKTKKRRLYEVENGENEVRLSDLPDGVILHILSFLNTKHVVRTCVLSKRWEHLWKRISTLILHSSRFSSVKQFAMLVSKILTLRDSSTALRTLDLDRTGNIEPQLLNKILNYVYSHNTHLEELGISLQGETCLIMRCVSSCQALASLRLSISPRDAIYSNSRILFPKSLNLPELTSLHLSNFTFCGGENGCAEPFSAFTKLNSLVIGGCELKDAQILDISSETLNSLVISGCELKDAQTLNISSETLVNLAMHHISSHFSKIELFTPSLCTFTFTGRPFHNICGTDLSSVRQVNIDALMYSIEDKAPMVLFNWLLEFTNVKSLIVSSTTLQILSLVPDLLEVELPSLGNLKSMEIKLEPPEVQLGLPFILKDAMLKRAITISRKEAAKVRKAFKAGWKPPSIPDGIVNFLLQNSPSAKVDITTIY